MIHINLLADRHAKDRSIIQQQLVLGVGILIGSIFLCGFWWQAKASQIDSANLRIEQAKKELEVQKRIREEVKKMEAKEKQLAAVLKAIESLVEFKRGPAPYLDEMNVMLPGEIWLTSLSDTRGQLTAQGYSFSNTAVARFMKTMEESETFANVELRELIRNKVGLDTLMKFNIQLMTSQGLKLFEEEKKKKAEAEASKKQPPTPGKPPVEAKGR
jgi:type IV pilus assembly protein PilN